LHSVLSKDDCKISASFKQIQNFDVSNLAMAKVKKVNIAVTYLLVAAAKTFIDSDLVGAVKMLNFTLDECSVAKLRFSNHRHLRI
jgi:hypothetical protein